MTRSTMREHIFKLLFRAPFIDNKDEYEEQINLYFADADMVDASHLKEEEYNYIKDKTLAIIATTSSATLTSPILTFSCIE